MDAMNAKAFRMQSEVSPALQDRSRVQWREEGVAENVGLSISSPPTSPRDAPRDTS